MSETGESPHALFKPTLLQEKYGETGTHKETVREDEAIGATVLFTAALEAMNKPLSEYFQILLDEENRHKVGEKWDEVVEKVKRCGKQVQRLGLVAMTAVALVGSYYHTEEPMPNGVKAQSSDPTPDHDPRIKDTSFIEKRLYLGSEKENRPELIEKLAQEAIYQPKHPAEPPIFLTPNESQFIGQRTALPENNNINIDHLTNIEVSSIPNINFRDYKLPVPQVEGRRGVERLNERLQDPNLKLRLDRILNAEQRAYEALKEKYKPDLDPGTVTLATAWLWFENADFVYTDSKGYPNTFFTNNRDNRNLWSVSRIMQTQRFGDLQINGIQVTGGLREEISMREWYTTLYSDDPEAFRDHLNRIIKNSANNGVEEWDYVNAPYNGVIKQFLTPERQLKDDIDISIDDIAISHDQFNNDPKSNFITMLAMKDETLGLVLNSIRVDKNLIPTIKARRSGEKIYGYIGNAELQHLSNIIGAIEKARNVAREEQ